MTQLHNRSAKVASLTHQGLVRGNNEDFCVFGELAGERYDAGASAEFGQWEQPLLFVMCDGMGGKKGGEVASEMACKIIWQELGRAFSENQTPERAISARLLRRAVRTAHGTLKSHGESHSHLHGMGTTCSAVLLVRDEILIAHVGDCRLYIKRGDFWVQITRDQSLAELGRKQKKRNSIDSELEEKAIVLQALGASDEIDVALLVLPLCKTDRLLLCTDGLHGVINDAALKYATCGQGALPDIARHLIKLSLHGGAPDNVTALLIDIAGDDFPEHGGVMPRAHEFDPSAQDAAALDPSSTVDDRLAQYAKRGKRARTHVPQTEQHILFGPTLMQDLGLAALATPPPTESRPQRRQLAWIGAVVFTIAVILVAWWTLR